MMLSLAYSNATPAHQTAKSSEYSTQAQYKKWEYYHSEGHRLHDTNDIKQAITYFEKAVAVGLQMKHFVPRHPDIYSGLYMSYMSMHNLAACYNRLHKCAKGKMLLLKLHNELMTIISNRFNEKALRLEALSIIDKSLFSLISQLAHLNDTKNIHGYITDTEVLVKKVSATLIG